MKFFCYIVLFVVFVSVIFSIKAAVAIVFFASLLSVCLWINRMVNVPKKKRKSHNDDLMLTPYEDVIERGPIY